MEDIVAIDVGTSIPLPTKIEQLESVTKARCIKYKLLEITLNITAYEKTFV